MGRCPTLLDVFFVADCNNSSASFKVIWSKRFLRGCYRIIIYVYIYLVWGSCVVIIYYIIPIKYIYKLSGELVQSVVVIRWRGGESTPHLQFSRRARGCK